MRAFLSTLALALAATPAFAQVAPVVQEVPGSSLDVTVVISTILYGAIGILLTLAGYFVFDKVVGLDLKRELVEDQNTAIGIMLAGVFIGCSIVVAAVMIS